MDRELIGKMNLANCHRGPDASGIFTEDGISLGHNRLSIIDLSDRASQPMKSFDDQEVIVFNGEIYNFKDLKKELKNFYPFGSESDTELILAAYRRWGADCVKKFNGIFAFALWDRSRREIFLARDHFGVKPLYYYLKDGKFVFSSEIKSILEHDIARRLNREAFSHYFRVLYSPEPLTMFEDIYKFPQASCGFLKNGKLNIKKYWQAAPGDYPDKPGEFFEEELRNRMGLAVKRQLISDRPLGLYLSGGVDSSILLYNMSKIHKDIDTFSVGFDLEKEEQREKFNADFDLARKTSAILGSRHHEVLIKPAEVFGLLEKAAHLMDEPISNPTAVSMLKLSEFSKQKVDVVLAGDGGDELFGGYERYRISFAASLLQKAPGFLRKTLNLSRKLKKLNTPAGIERFELFMFQKDDILKRVMSSDYFNYDISKLFFERRYFGRPSETSDSDFKTVFSGNFEEKLMNVDRQTWLVDFALGLTDKMSMARGLEVRVPFLDKDLAEFSMRVPLNYKVDLFNTKKILKSAYRGLIPDYLLNQPKRGWFSPGAKWLRMDEIREKARDAVSADYYFETRGLFNWPEIMRVFDGHIAGREYNLTILWALLTFQIWAKRYSIRI